MIITTEAVALSSRKFGDTSRIASYFTRDKGKISVLAKGARAAKSKYGPALEPLSYASLTYYQKQGRDLHLLSAAELVSSFKKLVSSYEHIAVGLLIVESISQTHHENVPNEELFDYLIDTFRTLNSAEQNEFSIFVAFQFKLAESLGFWIDFDADHVNDPNIRYYVSLANGAPAAPGQGERVFGFDFETLAALIQIFRLPLANACDVILSTRAKNLICDFFVQYFSFHLEKKFCFKSYNLLTV